MAIAAMDAMTAQNAALVEQAAAAAHSMQEEARALTRAVGVCTLRAPPGVLAAVPARRAAAPTH